MVFSSRGALQNDRRGALHIKVLARAKYVLSRVQMRRGRVVGVTRVGVAEALIASQLDPRALQDPCWSSGAAGRVKGIVLKYLAQDGSDEV